MTHKLVKVSDCANKALDAIKAIHRIIKREGDAVPVLKINMHLSSVEESLKDIVRLTL